MSTVTHQLLDQKLKRMMIKQNPKQWRISKAMDKLLVEPWNRIGQHPHNTNLMLPDQRSQEIINSQNIQQEEIPEKSISYICHELIVYYNYTRN